MTKEEKAELNSIEQVALVLVKIPAEVRDLEEFKTNEEVFNTTSEKLHAALGTQEKIGSGARTTAESALDIMADTIVTYTLRAKVKANDGKHAELFDALNKPVTYYTKGAKTVLVERAKEASKTLFNNLEFLTNISKENVAEIDAVIEVYNTTKNEPIANIKERKAQGTDIIPGLFDVNRDAIDNLFDLTFSYLSKTDGELISAFESAKHITNTGIRHTGITFEILDADNGKPIEGATITDIKAKKVYVTDENGDVHIDRHLAGTFHFMIEAKGKPSKDYVAVIKRGVDNSFVIKI